MVTQIKRPAWRLAGLTAAVLAAVVIAVLLFPSARAFADGVIKQIGGYGFTQGDAQTDPGRGPGPINVVKTHNSVSVQITGNIPSASDLATASQLAGFTVLAPSYLPAGYSAMSDWLVTPQDHGATVTKGYRDGSNHFFMVNQWKVGDTTPRNYARDAIVDVTIHGQAGVWLPDNSAGPARKNALVWAENGITYSLTTDSLGMQEMLKVAEGMGR